MFPVPMLPSQPSTLPQPQPGQIWEVSRSVRHPMETSLQLLYSTAAQAFLQGRSAPRYVLIVTEPEGETAWQVVSVMVLSHETQYCSDVDIVLPPSISGLEQAILAETWHIQEMLVCNLHQRVGQRLSRPIYDVLLAIGDAQAGWVENPERSTLQQLGLQVGSPRNLQAFYPGEEAWSDVLTVPLAGSRAYLQAERILTDAIQVEQDFASLDRVTLSRWFQGIVERNWQPFAEFWQTQPSLAIATRSDVPPSEETTDAATPVPPVTTLVHQLRSESDEHLRRQLIKRLGDVSGNPSEAIAELVRLLPCTTDDETLWTIVESLWKLDPGNAAVGARQVRVIDFGMQLAGQGVALAVALVQKTNQQVGVLLQVYPLGEAAFLPSDLKLVLLNAAGYCLREVVSRQADVYIQLKLSGEPGETFSVRVQLDHAQITEDFVI